MSSPAISLIVAMDENRLIGAGGELPWHLPADLKRFRDITMGKPVIMGRKTYESIPARFRPLPGRHNIVVTRNLDFNALGCTIVHSVTDALAAAGECDEIMIGGGAQLYEQCLPLASRLYLTLVKGVFTGDTYFPEIDAEKWREVIRQEFEPDQQNRYGHTFVILERRAVPA